MGHQQAESSILCSTSTKVLDSLLVKTGPKRNENSQIILAEIGAASTL